MTPPRIELPQFGPQRGSASLQTNQALPSQDKTAISNIGEKAARGAAPSASQALPTRPRSKRPVLTSHRHDANPALALKVLQDIHLAVDSWHQELRQIINQIQELYLEGPIVEGWLEAVPDGGSGPAPEANDSALLRHADPQQLQAYVNQRWGQTAPGQSLNPEPPRYNLCRLDSDGRMQCQPCPPDQLSHITLAVARHQRLRQYLSQKHYLEARLKRAVEVLGRVRQELDIAPSPDKL